LRVFLEVLKIRWPQSSTGDENPLDEITGHHRLDEFSRRRLGNLVSLTNEALDNSKKFGPDVVNVTQLLAFKRCESGGDDSNKR
jgi:hypothetical protein